MWLLLLLLLLLLLSFAARVGCRRFVSTSSPLPFCTKSFTLAPFSFRGAAESRFEVFFDDSVYPTFTVEVAITYAAAKRRQVVSSQTDYAEVTVEVVGVTPPGEGLGNDGNPRSSGEPETGASQIATIIAVGGGLCCFAIVLSAIVGLVVVKTRPDGHDDGNRQSLAKRRSKGGVSSRSTAADDEESTLLAPALQTANSARSARSGPVGTSEAPGGSYYYETETNGAATSSATDSTMQSPSGASSAGSYDGGYDGYAGSSSALSGSSLGRSWTTSAAET